MPVTANTVLTDSITLRYMFLTPWGLILMHYGRKFRKQGVKGPHLPQKELRVEA